jgi:hypothetical protein
VDPLLEGLAAVLGADGVRAFAAEYAGRRFVGRSRERAALDAWHASDDPVLLVVAPAGRGKSALVYRWAAAVAEVAWLPVSARFGTTHGAAARRLLAARLNALGLEVGDGDWVDAVRRATRPVTIVIDGLDEAADDLLLQDLRALAGAPHARAVVAARELVGRDAAGWAALLGWREPRLLDLPALDRGAVAALLGDERAAPAIVSEVMRISEGDPLVASLVADEVRRAGVTPEVLARVRAGLDGVFAAWLGAAAPSATTRALCVGLASAAAPIRPELLADVLGVELTELRAALAPWARFVITNPSGEIAFAHPRLGYYFRDPLAVDARRRVDAAYADATRRRADRLLAGGALDAETPYVLACHRLHLERAGAALPELARLLDPAWLAAWERLEGGSTGFLADLDGVWRAADAAPPTAETARTQVLCCCLAALLRSSEGRLSPRARREAVRLGLRSQRAAIASLAAIAQPWEHAQAVAGLLDALDHAGFEALLTTAGAPRGLGWPVGAIARRLLADGNAREALRWLGDPQGDRIRWIAAAIDAAEGDARRALEEAIAEEARRRLEDDQDPGLDVEAIALAARSAPRLAPPLVAALDARIAAISEDDLDWDPYEGGIDPRLVVAQAWSRLGEPTPTGAWIDRVLARPYPVHDDPEATPGPEVVAAVARCATGLGRGAVAARLARRAADLADAVADDRRLEAQVELVAAGVVVERDRLAGRLAAAPARDSPVLRRALGLGDPMLRGVAARRLLAIAEDAARALAPADAGGRYDAGYWLHHSVLDGLGDGAGALDPGEAARAAALVWDVLRPLRPPTVQWTHLVAALVPLLARAPDERIARALYEEATRRDDAGLCEHPQWEAVWDEAARRAYLDRAVQARQLTDRTRWVEGLTALAAQLEPGPDRDAVVEWARRVAGDQWRLITRAARVAGPHKWAELAQLVTAAYQAGGAEPWALHDLATAAPTDADRAAIARVAFAAPDRLAQMGCVADLLAALPTPEAEDQAERLDDTRAFALVTPRSLPPRARQRWLDRQRARAAAAGLEAHASFLVRARDALDDAELAAFVEALAPALAEAPDESAAEHPAAPPWKALASVTAVLGPDALAGFFGAVLARGADGLKRAFAQAWAALGEPARQLALLDALGAPRDADTLAAAVARATSPSEVAAALSATPSGLAWPWVAERSAAVGAAAELVAVARGLDAGPRLVAWDHAWRFLDDAQRAALVPEAGQAALAEPRRPPHARWRWLDRLPPDVVEALWRRDLGADATYDGPPGFLVLPFLAYAGPLGSAGPFAAAMAEALGWFVAMPGGGGDAGLPAPSPRR